MNFHDRPNADPKFLRRVIAQREADRERQVERSTDRERARPERPTSLIERILALVREGLTDKAIARECDCGASTVGRVRNAAGIPPNFDRSDPQWAARAREAAKAAREKAGTGKPRVSDVRIAALITDGLSDHGIARMLGVKTERVRQVRAQQEAA